jgi:hypothetical protein
MVDHRSFVGKGDDFLDAYVPWQWIPWQLHNPVDIKVQHVLRIGMLSISLKG